MSCLLPSLSLIFFWTLSPLPISPFCSPPCLHLSPFPPSTILSLCLYLCPPTLPLPFPPSLPIYMYLLLLPPPPHSLPLSRLDSLRHICHHTAARLHQCSGLPHAHVLLPLRLPRGKCGGCHLEALRLENRRQAGIQSQHPKLGSFRH